VYRVRRELIALSAAGACLLGCSSASSSRAAPARTAATGSVRLLHVQRPSSVTQNVHVTFNAARLPHGGYYYAVVVLQPYGHYTSSSPPPCATSSNMQRTDYGYPRSNSLVALVLTPTRSATGHWCRGGTYSGAIYAVPQKPPCEGRYPCRSEPYEPPSPCWQVGGHVVCGVVALPGSYRYPDGLPRPLARGTSVLAHFTLRFPR
jgi:hypothetical protein